jgi:hypothetical protein
MFDRSRWIQDASQRQHLRAVKALVTVKNPLTPTP